MSQTSNGRYSRNSLNGTGTVPVTQQKVQPQQFRLSEFIGLIRPAEMYEIIEQDGLETRRLSAKFLNWLMVKLPALSMPPRRIAAMISRSDGFKSLKKKAASIADLDPLRAAKRARAATAIEQAQLDIKEFENRRKWRVRALRFISPTVTRWRLRPEKILSLKMFPSLVGLGFWGAFFTMSLTAELSNSTNLLMTAGMGFSTSWLSALFSIFAVVSVPFVSLKFLDATLGQEGRRIFSYLLTIVSIPLSLVVIVYFSKVIGGAHGDVDIFAEADPGTPPFYVLYMLAMLGLALSIVMIGKFLKQSLEHFYDFEASDNPVHMSATRHVKVLDHAIAIRHADYREAQRVVSELDNERQQFVTACCDQLADLKGRINSAQAQFLSNEGN